MNKLTRFEPYEKTIFNVNSHELSRKSIFISIVSYRDPYVLGTIKSMIRNAKNPDNLFISVVISEVDSESPEWVSECISFYKENRRNISLELVNASKSTLYGELKRKADSNYNKQDYYLSVSPRSQFDPHWDSLLIKQYNDLKSLFEEDFIFTADTRRFLPHDEVVKGFVYYTNHKTKQSMQREEYDGARIPMSGFNEFTNTSNSSMDLSYSIQGTSMFDFLNEKESVKQAQIFLKKYGVPIFSSRKFVKDEYVALSYGISDKFIFSDAKQYLRVNSSDKTLIDINQFNYYSFINFIKSNFLILSLRFTPVYQLYQDNSGLIFPEKNIIDLYTDEEYKNSDGGAELGRMTESHVFNNDRMLYLLSIDWRELKFKEKVETESHPVVNSINSLISLYNFSTYENTLHWNKKC